MTPAAYHGQGPLTPAPPAPPGPCDRLARVVEVGGAALQHHAVGEHGDGEALDVVGDGVVAAVGRAPRPARRGSRPWRAAGRDAEQRDRGRGGSPRRSTACSRRACPRRGPRSTASWSAQQLVARRATGVERARAAPRRRPTAAARARRRAAGSRARCASGSGRAATRAADRCRSARAGSGSRAPGTAAAAGGALPSTETWPSLIASSSADCVRGVVRLISSASTTLAKIGPGLELEAAWPSGRRSRRR